MRVVQYHSYGTPEVLQLTQLPKPVVGKDDILVKVITTTVTAADWRLRKADPFLARLFNGLFRPKKHKILGLEIAGIVSETGSNITRFKVNDAVFAHCLFQFGGYAEYRLFKEADLVVHKPENCSFEAAAATPVGACTALKMLEKLNLRKGDAVLIYGASGSVGSYAVQLANSMGCHVTAVCSFSNTDWVKQQGADKVIDYTTVAIENLGETYNAVIDAVGKLQRSSAKKLLTSGGRFGSVNRVHKITLAEMVKIQQLLTEGVLQPVIDRIYPLEAIRDAHAYVESFRKKGNVVIRVADDPGLTMI